MGRGKLGWTTPLLHCIPLLLPSLIPPSLDSPGTPPWTNYTYRQSGLNRGVERILSLTPSLPLSLSRSLALSFFLFHDYLHDSLSAKWSLRLPFWLSPFLSFSCREQILCNCLAGFPLPITPFRNDHGDNCDLPARFVKIFNRDGNSSFSLIFLCLLLTCWMISNNYWSRLIAYN